MCDLVVATRVLSEISARPKLFIMLPNIGSFRRFCNVCGRCFLTSAFEGTWCVSSVPGRSALFTGRLHLSLSSGCTANVAGRWCGADKSVEL